jgi:hypothetical protein
LQSKQGDGARAAQPQARKAGFLQVASTMFWALFMIGKKGTWEKDGATITLGQAVVGAVVAGLVVVLILIALVQLALG